MTATIIWAYAALSIFFWAHAVIKMAARARRPDPLLGMEERVILVAVALLSSALWAIILPFYAIGALQKAFERRSPVTTHGVRQTMGMRRLSPQGAHR